MVPDPWPVRPSWMYDRKDKWLGDEDLPDHRAEEEHDRYQDRLVARDDNVGLDRAA